MLDHSIPFTTIGPNLAGCYHGTHIETTGYLHKLLFLVVRGKTPKLLVLLLLASVGCVPHPSYGISHCDVAILGPSLATTNRSPCSLDIHGRCVTIR